MKIRNIAPTDLDVVLALNQGALDAVGPLDLERLSWIVSLAENALVADIDGEIGGFVVTLGPGTAYDSPNYAWFGHHFGEHPYTYLDRIVVAPGHRRTGIASLLYDAVEGRSPVGLEVYCEPPNVASLAFHAARGYEEIGRQPQSNGKTVAMLVKPNQQGDTP